MPVIEIVSFELKHDTDVDEFLQAAAGVNQFLRRCPGFIHRELSSDEDLMHWIEIIHWDTRDNALAAAHEIMESIECQPFLALTDLGTVAMQHVKTQLTFTASD